MTFLAREQSQSARNRFGAKKDTACVQPGMYTPYAACWGYQRSGAFNRWDLGSSIFLACDVAKVVAHQPTSGYSFRTRSMVFLLIISSTEASAAEHAPDSLR
jgi:hypothetical protein